MKQHLKLTTLSALHISLTLISWLHCYTVNLPLTLSLVLLKLLVNLGNHPTFFFIIFVLYNWQNWLAILTQWLFILLFLHFIIHLQELCYIQEGIKMNMWKNLPILRHMNQKILENQQAQFPLHVASFFCLSSTHWYFLSFQYLQLG